jgi:hypothetical protein
VTVSLNLAQRGGPETIRVDVGALVRRLLLFDTYILESNRLLEIPRLAEGFGPRGLITLLQSGVLKIQCEAFTIGEVGRLSLSEKRRRLGPLPLGSLALATVKSADPEQYLHESLQTVNQTNLPLKQAIKVKKAIVENLENSPAEAGAETLANTRLDVGKPDLLKTAIVRAARQTAGCQVSPELLSVKTEILDEEDFRIESNLATITGLDQVKAHDVLAQAVLAIAGVNSRIEAMKAHDCLSGVMGEDVAFLGEKLAFLWKEIAPQRQEARFDRVIELTGLPDISTAAEDHRIDVDRLLKARETRECAEFRDWVQRLDDLTDKDIVQRVRGIKAIADGLVQSTGPGRGACISAAPTCGWRAHSSPRADKGHPKGIRGRATSADHRAGCSSKKSSDVAAGTAEACPARLSVATDQYENLRRAALGDPLQPEARSGLAIFLRRGMWGWAQSLSTMTTRRESMPTAWSDSMMPVDRGDVIHLLAAMAMNADERRA